MIKEIRGVDKMLKLQTLLLVGCRDLQHLPNLEYLSNLQVFDVSGCSNLRINFHLPRQKLIRYITDIVSPWVIFTRGMMEFQYGRPTKSSKGVLSETLKHRMELDGVLRLSCKYYNTVMILNPMEGPYGTFVDDVAFEEGEWQESRRCKAILLSDALLKSGIYGTPFEFDGDCDSNCTAIFPLNNEDRLDEFLFESSPRHVDVKTSSTDSLGKDGGSLQQDKMPENTIINENINERDHDEEDMSIPEMAFIERDFIADIVTKYFAREERRRALYDVPLMQQRDSEDIRVGPSDCDVLACPSDSDA